MYATRHISKRPRRGLTLIELLVVVFIILAVSAAIVPVIAPTAAGRRQREAARVVSTFISSARTRAIENGRPAGVWLEGLNNDPASVLSLAYCEVPPPYSGDALNTKIMYSVVGSTLSVSDIVYWHTPTSAWVSVAPLRLIQIGDLIRLNNRPMTFLITDGPVDSNRFLTDPAVNTPDPPGPDIAAAPWILVPTNPSMMMYDSSGNLVFPSAPRSSPDSATDGVSFEIIRQPQKSAASSVELPPGTVIDLHYSGDEFPLRPKSDASKEYLADLAAGNGIDTFDEPIIILFDSTGTPNSVFRFSENRPFGTPAPQPEDREYWRWGAEPLIRPLYLMVGKGDKVGLEFDPVPMKDDLLDPGDDLSPNLIDPANYWVSISPINGTVSTDEVATVSVMPANLAQLVQKSRAFAIEKLGIGGR